MVAVVEGGCRREIDVGCLRCEVSLQSLLQRSETFIVEQQFCLRRRETKQTMVSDVKTERITSHAGKHNP